MSLACLRILLKLSNCHVITCVCVFSVHGSNLTAQCFAKPSSICVIMLLD